VIAHWHNTYILITNSIQGKNAKAIMHGSQNLQNRSPITHNYVL